MFYVGNVDKKAQQLCEVTQFAMESAIAECGPGVPIRHIGKVSALVLIMLLCHFFNCCILSACAHL